VVGRFVFGPLILSVNLACSRSDREIRVWRPSDHEQETETKLSGPTLNNQNADGRITKNTSDDALSTWDSLCAECHGHVRAGLGPAGVALGARNFSDRHWQASTTDEQIAQSILHGRGRMPAFSLPRETISGLVQLVRIGFRDDLNGTVKP
jgi:hypothetical protein